jgi:hypothetical protein
MKIFTSLTTCAVLILLLGVGCNGRNANAGIIEPAAIISKEDANALTGASFGDCTVTEQTVVGMKLCVYDNGEDFLQIGVTQTAFMPEDNKRNPKDIFTGIKDAFPDAERIEGLGDDNFIAPPGLHILKGEYYISLSLGPMARDREKLKAAGMKAIENLEKLSQE